MTKLPVTQTVRIGTRGSALAMAQTQAIADRISKAGNVETVLVPIVSQGDTSRESLSVIGGVGVFTNALREALLAGECDLIVHSLKDLPTALHPGITLAAVPKRVDARDTLCSRDGLHLDTLAAGAKVGTGSPRRIAQLAAARPDLDVRDIRGNVDSRLKMVASGELDAVVLAAAGLNRLGRASSISQHLELSEWPTAPGQGALGLEVRSSDPSDTALGLALAALDHPVTRACVAAERGVLAGLDAGCSAPLGATAVIDDGMLFLTATVYALDGSTKLTSSHAATLNSTSPADMDEAARDVAERIVTELLGAGAGALTADRPAVDPEAP